jgi:hypothetical protein
MKMEKLLEIVNYNITVRQLDISIDLNTLEGIIFRQENLSIGNIISSKGINRLKSLYDFINGYNSQNNQLISWFNIIKPRYLTILVACYIINAQVFSDGNHRTAELYLIKSGYYSSDVSKVIIDIIKEIRSICMTDFSSTTSYGSYLGFPDYVNSMDHIYNNSLFKYSNPFT